MAEEDLDLENLDPAEPANWARLRDFAARQQKRAGESEAIRRENAMLRAGIDLSSRVGQAFASTYAGKLDDAEAIRTDARDFDPRIVQGQASEPAQEGQSQVPQNTGSQERSTLADGAMPSAGAPETTQASSLTRAREIIDRGAQWEVGAGELVSMRARAMQDGSLQQSIDQRTGNKLRAR